MTCPSAPAGYDYFFEGIAYKSYLGASADYYTAAATCRDEGARLPTFVSQEEYNGARTMAGGWDEQFDSYLIYDTLASIFFIASLV